MLYRAAALTADHLGMRITIESGGETVVGRIAQIRHRQVGNPPTDVETLLDIDVHGDHRPSARDGAHWRHRRG